MVAACKKKESTNTAFSPEAHQQELLKKSFELSRKDIVAKVNGEEITMFSVLREMNQITPQYLKSGQQKTPELYEKIKADALNILIFQSLAVQEAEKRGIKVKPEVIDGEIKKIRTSKGTEDAYQQYLAGQGLTENELRKSIEQDILFEMIATQEVDAKTTVAVTDAVLRERYKREKTGLKDTAHRKMSFEAAKGMLEQKIRAEAGEKRMQEWEKELRDKAQIEIMKQKQG